MLTTLIILLAVALGVFIYIADERYKRVRRRLGRLERAQAESLLLLKPICSQQQLDRMVREGKAPRREIEFRSQFGEDVLLWHLFRGKTDGFYIEVGAYDGYTYAVTYAFESMGWTGLLVEPIPERHAACKALRKWSQVEHAALSKKGSSGTATFAHITSNKQDYEASSFLPGSVTKKRFMRPPSSKKGGTTQSITVPLTTMDNLLKDYQGKVDFMVLDVEGAEMNLLDGFDLDRYQPAVMVVEDQAMGADRTLLNYLEGKGYQHVMWLSYNRVLIRKDRPDILERARQVAQAGHKGVTL